jgi:hypothetical protein
MNIARKHRSRSSSTNEEQMDTLRESELNFIKQSNFLKIEEYLDQDTKVLQTLKPAVFNDSILDGGNSGSTKPNYHKRFDPMCQKRTNTTTFKNRILNRDRKLKSDDLGAEIQILHNETIISRMQKKGNLKGIKFHNENLNKEIMTTF